MSDTILEIMTQKLETIPSSKDFFLEIKKG